MFLSFFSYSAILFLAPISCFDQVLAEDQSVNRLVSAAQPSLCRSRDLCTTREKPHD